MVTLLEQTLNDYLISHKTEPQNPQSSLQYVMKNRWDMTDLIVN